MPLEVTANHPIITYKLKFNLISTSSIYLALYCPYWEQIKISLHGLKIEDILIKYVLNEKVCAVRIQSGSQTSDSVSWLTAVLLQQKPD